MGRAIDMENRIDTLEHKLKLVEDALEELLEKGTKVHHVDLTENIPATVKKKRKATAVTT